MRVRLLFLMALSTACTPSEPLESLDAHTRSALLDPSPSPAPPSLSVQGLAAGHHALFSVEGLAVGERTHILIGSALGDGPCLGVIGGQCLGITAPFMRIGEGIANAEGVAHVVVEVPTSVADDRLGVFQAWTRRGPTGDGSVSSAPLEAPTVAPDLPEITGHWTDPWGTAHHINRRTWTQRSMGSLDGFDDRFHLVDTLHTGEGTTLIAQNDADNLYSPGAWSRFDTVFTEDGTLYYCQQAYAADSYDDALGTPAADTSDPETGGCGIPPYVFSFTALDPVELPILGAYTDPYDGEHLIDGDTWTISYTWGSSASSVSRFHLADWIGGETSGAVIAQNSEEDPYDPGAWSRFDYVLDEGTLYYCQTLYNAGSEAEAYAHPGADSEAPAEGGCGEAPYDFPWSTLTPE